MRYSQALIPTRKENPVDAELPSHRLLLRAGYIEQLTAGIYTLMPLAWRCARKIEAIVREELDAAGAQELLLPMVQPAEIWQLSGRWDHYGKELLRFKDRKNQDFCLSPTHEEGITDLAKRHLRSYRNMPINLYQIQVKFRDEIRPRGGLMRGREFIMKDGYSFDADYVSAEASYQRMYRAYERIFTRCGLAFRAVEADSGNIGGSHSHEFQVLAQTGEDRILSCAACGYAANEEKAEVKRNQVAQAGSGFVPSSETPQMAEVHTPNARTIDEISAFLALPPEQFIKTLIYLADGKPVAVLLQGNRSLNEVKLQRLLSCEALVLASDTAVHEATQAETGYAGPCGLQIPIYADLDILTMHDCATGANRSHYHVVHVEPGRDFQITKVDDLVLAQEGDPCPRCSQPLQAFRGIEVGHVFLLGTKYSEPMGAHYLDDKGESHPCVMGCYGIGITRVLAAAVEQYHDENGINFPTSIAPYHVILAPLQLKDEAVIETTERLYAELQAAGVEVLLDDRDIRPGVKFKDDDLIGVPYRITVGEKNLAQGKVEFKHRTEKTAQLLDVTEIVAHVRSTITRDLAATMPQ
ncbi:MAG: proline--tRNA ligase [Proteobacteria bacterium]|nr:proline--tRNA ligase [Pseudomonadota bacterium]